MPHKHVRSLFVLGQQLQLELVGPNTLGGFQGGFRRVRVGDSACFLFFAIGHQALKEDFPHLPFTCDTINLGQMAWDLITSLGGWLARLQQ